MNAPAARELAGQTAVVTGASRGIGRAIALELAAAGAAVLVHAHRRGDLAEETARQARECGVEAATFLADLTDPAAAGPFVEQAWQWRGGMTIWVNNAGADILTGPLGQASFAEKLQALWQLDVAAAIGLSRAAGGRMRAAGGGAIVNVGWDGAARGMATDSGQLFAAAKGAIMAFSRSLAQALAPAVRVNCVAPGFVRTAWGEQASEAWQERVRRSTLLGRWGEPEDIARAIRFLVSPAAAFITGQVLDVNGGRNEDR